MIFQILSIFLDMLRYFLMISFFSAFVFADGAASLVGKSSKVKNYTYSPILKFEFMNDCSENANRDVCECVLDKLQLRYSEETYQKLDSDLRRGMEHPDFVKYISDASTECDLAVKSPETEPPAESDFSQDLSAPAVGVSEAEATEFVNNFKKNFPKKNFVKECVETTSKFFGTAALQKSCGCAYDKMLSDKPRFIDMVMRQGYPGQNSSWGAEFKLDCLPEKFTPEIEKNMVNFLNEVGIPLSAAKCIIATTKKEYSLKSFAKAVFNSQESMAAMLMMGSLKCLESK